MTKNIIKLSLLFVLLLSGCDSDTDIDETQTSQTVSETAAMTADDVSLTETTQTTSETEMSVSETTQPQTETTETTEPILNIESMEDFYGETYRISKEQIINISELIKYTMDNKGAVLRVFLVDMNNDGVPEAIFEEGRTRIYGCFVYDINTKEILTEYSCPPIEKYKNINTQNVIHISKFWIGGSLYPWYDITEEIAVNENGVLTTKLMFAKYEIIGDDRDDVYEYYYFNSEMYFNELRHDEYEQYRVDEKLFKELEEKYYGELVEEKIDRVFIGEFTCLLPGYKEKSLDEIATIVVDFLAINSAVSPWEELWAT